MLTVLGCSPSDVPNVASLARSLCEYGMPSALFQRISGALPLTVVREILSTTCPAFKVAISIAAAVARSRPSMLRYAQAWTVRLFTAAKPSATTQEDRR